MTTDPKHTMTEDEIVADLLATAFAGALEGETRRHPGSLQPGPASSPKERTEVNFNTDRDEKATAEKRAEMKQNILRIIADKDGQELAGKSIDELRALAATL